MKKASGIVKSKSFCVVGLCLITERVLCLSKCRDSFRVSVNLVQRAGR